MTTSTRTLYCTRCGSSRVAVIHESLDPRWPIVHCHACRGKVPAVDDGIQAAGIARAYAERVHPDHVAVKPWCVLCSEHGPAQVKAGDL